MQAVTQALLELLRTGQAGALATVVQVSGSTPQVAGARLLRCADGSAIGTIGGGAIEHAVLQALEEVQLRGVSRLLHWDLGRDLGMCCGGSMSIFLEPVTATPRLWLFGAGHVAQPTAALARSVGFELTIVDEREEWNTAERFPQCRLELSDPVSVLTREALGQRDWLLITTHEHRLDEEALRAALKTPARYIGLVGSRRKVHRLLQRISAREGTPPDTTRLYAPVGLNLGALSPAELAVSIVAELVALRHGVASLEHLRAMQGAPLAQRSVPPLGERPVPPGERPVPPPGERSRAVSPPVSGHELRGTALDEEEGEE